MPEVVNGWKTYTCVVLALLVIGASSVGWIDDAVRDGLLAALGFGGLAALRHGLHRGPTP